MKKLVVIIFATVLLFVLGFTVYAALPQRSIQYGAWTQGFFDAKTRSLHPEVLRQFEQLTRKHVAIAHYYRGWEYLPDPILVSEFETIRNYGWQPMINVNPYYFSECPASDKPLYRAIADGQCDEFLHKAGKNLSQVKEPFYFLFAWEMNNDSLEWSIDRTGSQPEDYIAAWRHMHDIFASEGANNVIWVFCPNVTNDRSIAYDRMYPGDAYVDWTGIDGYNWGTTQSWSEWSSFSGTFTTSYRHLLAIAPSKPIMIAEFNTTDKGGDKAAWYTEALTKEIPYNFPQVKAIVIYNEDRTEQEKVNWKVDVSKESLRAFIKGIDSKFYK